MDAFRLGALGAFLLAGFTVAAAAEAGDYFPPAADLETRKLCGECHLAFPPALLPARSWAALLDRQADHFGEDLALTLEEAARVKAHLMPRAGDAGSGRLNKFMRWVAPDGTPTRITENPAFLRKHNFPARVWRDPKVMARSNCQACHAGADQGWFDDD